MILRGAPAVLDPAAAAWTPGAPANPDKVNKPLDATNRRRLSFMSTP
jgi:hypothetical protein